MQRGADRELDGLIEAAFLPARDDGWKPWPTKGGYVLTADGERPIPGCGQYVPARKYTSSIDALLARVAALEAQVAANEQGRMSERRRWNEHPAMQRLDAVRQHIAGMLPADAESIATAQAEFMELEAENARLQAEIDRFREEHGHFGEVEIYRVNFTEPPDRP